MKGIQTAKLTVQRRGKLSLRLGAGARAEHHPKQGVVVVAAPVITNGSPDGFRNLGQAGKEFLDRFSRQRRGFGHRLV
jgi:hypothetical protein